MHTEIRRVDGLDNDGMAKETSTEAFLTSLPTTQPIKAEINITTVPVGELSVSESVSTQHKKVGTIFICINF